MDEEFKLCWTNFQDNISSGFQNFFDRGDLVDVTLACGGKLLQAHKFVLAICSPYFQEIFIKNPCRHPTIILKDVSYNIMCQLLEFMYQGIVNVKHTELQTFMTIGQELQIKGLTKNRLLSSTSLRNSLNRNNNAQTDQTNPDDENTVDQAEKSKAMELLAVPEKEDALKMEPTKSTQSPIQAMNSNVNNKSSNDKTTYQQQQQSKSKASVGSKRHLTTQHYNSDTLSVLNQSKIKRSMPSLEDMNESMPSNRIGVGDEVNSSTTPDNCIFPHISMTESRYDIMKRDVDNSSDSQHYQHIMHHHHHHQTSSHHANQTSAAAVAAAASLRSSFPPDTLGLDYAFFKNDSASSLSEQEYPNELYGDFSRNHMDILPIAPSEHCFMGNFKVLLSQRGKPLLMHNGHTFGIQYLRKDKKYWQCNLSRKFNCKARVTTTDAGKIIVTNNEHCHTEIRQHLRKDYQRNKYIMNAPIKNNLIASSASKPLGMQHHMDMNVTGEATGSILNLGKRKNHSDKMSIEDLHRRLGEQNQNDYEPIDFTIR